MPVLHLVPQREAVHRLQNDLRDQQVHLLPLRHVNRLLPRQRPLNIVARRLLQNLDHLPEIVLAVHYQDFHTLPLLISQAASAAAGRS
jgi:hypothetical protein